MHGLMLLDIKYDKSQSNNLSLNFDRLLPNFSSNLTSQLLESKQKRWSLFSSKKCLSLLTSIERTLLGISRIRYDSYTEHPTSKNAHYSILRSSTTTSSLVVVVCVAAINVEPGLGDRQVCRVLDCQGLHRSSFHVTRILFLFHFLRRTVVVYDPGL